MTALRKITALSLFLGASLAIPQKPTPPPKPTDNGPSLPDTLNYIKDKLLAVGTLSWSVTDPAVGNPYPQSINITVVTADPTGCTLQTKQVSGAGASWTVIPLKDIAEVSVSQLPEVNEFGWTVNEPRPYALTIESSRPTITTYLSDPSPSLTDQSTSSGKKHNTKQPPVPAAPSNTVKKYLFYFDKNDPADRTAKALVHAVDLCGGGNTKELF